MISASFPGIQNPNKKTIKAPSNPMDKATVVSIYPKEIEYDNPTIQPGRFWIPGGTYDKPTVLSVGPSSWWKELNDDEPLLEIPTSSVMIADSIVRDYCNGLLACNMNDRMPGLFFVPGSVTAVEVIAKHKDKLDKGLANQKRWFIELVKIADSLWARSNGNPLAISDEMRLAARELNLNSKEWLQDFQAAELIKCSGCGSMRNPLYPICPVCHNIIDLDLYKKLGIQKAEK